MRKTEPKVYKNKYSLIRKVTDVETQARVLTNPVLGIQVDGSYPSYLTMKGVVTRLERTPMFSMITDHILYKMNCNVPQELTVTMECEDVFNEHSFTLKVMVITPVYMRHNPKRDTTGREFFKKMQPHFTKAALHVVEQDAGVVYMLMGETETAIVSGAELRGHIAKHVFRD